MERLGAERGRIVAAIGPCIAQANYEVGPEFRERFPEAYFDGRQFDLEGYVAQRLAASGIEAVERVSACTYAREDEFFSFRRATHRGEADYGRQVSAIVLRT
jgi:copper oxidase (laccase) domain-containing protein